MRKIYIIHENDEWTRHLTARLDELHLPYESWHLADGLVDLSAEPPEGVFYSRMSASSHTRGHRYAPELAEGVIAWLEQHGRTVFNGSRALRLEVSKLNQYTALQADGFRTPKTIGAVGKEKILEAAALLDSVPFIIKHNRAGKGLGVRLFHSIDSLNAFLDNEPFEEPVDGITLIQQYIQSPESAITRLEFVGGKFVYAVQVDTSEGFELCPADSCRIDDAFCPVGEEADHPAKFQILDNFRDPIIKHFESFLQKNRISVAGIEFIRDAGGKIYTYDINTNTNYNSEAEARAGKYGMLELARFLGRALKVNASAV